MKGCQEILDLYLQDKPLSDDVDVKAIARGTPGFNGAGMFLHFKRLTLEYSFFLSLIIELSRWTMIEMPNLTHFLVNG